MAKSKLESRSPAVKGWILLCLLPLPPVGRTLQIITASQAQTALQISLDSPACFTDEVMFPKATQ